MMLRRRDLLAAALAAPATAHAQAGWPERPVRLLVGFGAGGAIDTLSRATAAAFPAQANGQTLVVENRPGAGGTIAAAALAQARPDGATLMMADVGANAIAHELMRGLTYDPRTAFQPVCHLASLPLCLLVPAASPARTASELFEMAKRGPEMIYANAGNGYVGHLAQELMLKQFDARMTSVVYRSGAEVIRSLLANETSSSVITVSTALPFIREGRIRALAVCSPEPVRAIPEVPTMAALLPGFQAYAWHGVVAPAGLPRETLAAANRAFNAVLAQPEVRVAIEERQAGIAVGGTPESFAAFIRAEIERWSPIIREKGISVS